MLRAERDRLCKIEAEIGGALAWDAVDEIERDVVESGITQMVERGPDGLGAGLPLEHGQQLGLEALGAERDARDPSVAEKSRQLRRDRLRVRLDGDLSGRRERREQAGELARLRERRRPAPEEDRLDLGSQDAALQLELCQERVDVGAVALASADQRDEVAVSAAVGAERQVHVEMPDAAAHLRSPSRLRTARNASCGTSTAPTCFMRFLPFFWRSRSLRLRVMSPP